MEDLGGTLKLVVTWQCRTFIKSRAKFGNNSAFVRDIWGRSTKSLCQYNRMDIWIENSNLPNCYEINNSASCDLDVENDMPRVISQEDLESGFGGTTLIVSIMALLLLGAGVAIVVLLRRDNSEQSIFYDDDEWEDEEDVEEVMQPILPPLTPNKPDVDAALEALEVKQEEVADGDEEEQDISDDESEKEPESQSDKDVDPWLMSIMVTPMNESTNSGFG